MKRFTRGELAKMSGVHIETIRYYEKVELLPKPPRSNAGYRMFSSESVNRLRFIKHAQDLGFSLREIKELLDLRVTPEAKRTDVRARAAEKLADIGNRIRHLRSMQKSLERLVNSCCGDGSIGDCPILESLDTKEEDSKSKEIHNEQ